jgi:formamidopyrimidine-DNA glycosylase
MPELPEVEYIARQLRMELIGRRVVSVAVSWSRSISGMDPAVFGRALAGCRITEVGRRGKYLLISLANDQVLIVHRGMSGNLLFGRTPQEALYVRVAFELDDGRYLLYSDPRKFGRLSLVPKGKLTAIFAELGPEPLDEAFTPDVLAAQLAGTKRPIKATLLDQKIVAGLGNIYADEALFAAHIHPLQGACELRRDQIEALGTAIQQVLQTGIAHGGTTFGRHRDVHNEAGTNLEHLMVYRRANQPCRLCGSAINRIVVTQRSTHYCPECQQLSG